MPIIDHKPEPCPPGLQRSTASLFKGRRFNPETAKRRALTDPAHAVQRIVDTCKVLNDIHLKPKPRNPETLVETALYSLNS